MLDQESLPHYGTDHDFYLRARQQGVVLFIATHATAAIDNKRTSLAHDAGTLNGAKFLQSSLVPKLFAWEHSSRSSNFSKPESKI
ncbi:hypothetical protein [Methylotuvimicrobium sp.]|uniref:hypothetical protein n=1 Tax=Methylotuvimicrobium sp. TaxID=2822413 RepID=UPI003D64C22B